METTSSAFLPASSAGASLLWVIPVLVIGALVSVRLLAWGATILAKRSAKRRGIIIEIPPAEKGEAEDTVTDVVVGAAAISSIFPWILEKVQRNVWLYLTAALLFALSLVWSVYYMEGSLILDWAWAVALEPYVATPIVGVLQVVRVIFIIWTFVWTTVWGLISFAVRGASEQGVLCGYESVTTMMMEISAGLTGYADGIVVYIETATPETHIDLTNGTVHIVRAYNQLWDFVDCECHALGIVTNILFVAEEEPLVELVNAFFDFMPGEFVRTGTFIADGGLPAASGLAESIERLTDAGFDLADSLVNMWISRPLTLLQIPTFAIYWGEPVSEERSAPKMINLPRASAEDRRSAVFQVMKQPFDTSEEEDSPLARKVAQAAIPKARTSGYRRRVPRRDLPGGSDPLTPVDPHPYIPLPVDPVPVDPVPADPTPGGGLHPADGGILFADGKRAARGERAYLAWSPPTCEIDPATNLYIPNIAPDGKSQVSFNASTVPSLPELQAYGVMCSPDFSFNLYSDGTTGVFGTDELINVIDKGPIEHVDNTGKKWWYTAVLDSSGLYRWVPTDIGLSCINSLPTRSGTAEFNLCPCARMQPLLSSDPSILNGSLPRCVSEQFAEELPTSRFADAGAEAGTFSCQEEFDGFAAVFYHTCKPPLSAADVNSGNDTLRGRDYLSAQFSVDEVDYPFGTGGVCAYYGIDTGSPAGPQYRLDPPSPGPYCSLCQPDRCSCSEGWAYNTAEHSCDCSTGREECGFLPPLDCVYCDPLRPPAQRNCMYCDPSLISGCEECTVCAAGTGSPVLAFYPLETVIFSEDGLGTAENPNNVVIDRALDTSRWFTDVLVSDAMFDPDTFKILLSEPDGDEAWGLEILGPIGAGTVLQCDTESPCLLYHGFFPDASGDQALMTFGRNITVDHAFTAISAPDVYVGWTGDTSDPEHVYLEHRVELNVHNGPIELSGYDHLVPAPTKSIWMSPTLHEAGGDPLFPPEISCTEQSCTGGWHQAQFGFVYPQDASCTTWGMTDPGTGIQCPAGTSVTIEVRAYVKTRAETSPINFYGVLRDPLDSRRKGYFTTVPVDTTVPGFCTKCSEGYTACRGECVPTCDPASFGALCKTCDTCANVCTSCATGATNCAETFEFGVSEAVCGRCDIRDFPNCGLCDACNNTCTLQQECPTGEFSVCSVKECYQPGQCYLPTVNEDGVCDPCSGTTVYGACPLGTTRCFVSEWSGTDVTLYGMPSGYEGAMCVPHDECVIEPGTGPEIDPEVVPVIVFRSTVPWFGGYKYATRFTVTAINSTLNWMIHGAIAIPGAIPNDHTALDYLGLFEIEDRALEFADWTGEVVSELTPYYPIRNGSLSVAKGGRVAVRIAAGVWRTAISSAWYFFDYWDAAEQRIRWYDATRDMTPGHTQPWRNLVAWPFSAAYDIGVIQAAQNETDGFFDQIDKTAESVFLPGLGAVLTGAPVQLSVRRLGSNGLRSVLDLAYIAWAAATNIPRAILGFHFQALDFTPFFRHLANTKTGIYDLLSVPAGGCGQASLADYVTDPDFIAGLEAYEAMTLPYCGVLKALSGVQTMQLGMSQIVVQYMQRGLGFVYAAAIGADWDIVSPDWDLLDDGMDEVAQGVGKFMALPSISILAGIDNAMITAEVSYSDHASPTKLYAVYVAERAWTSVVRAGTFSVIVGREFIINTVFGTDDFLSVYGGMLADFASVTANLLEDVGHLINVVDKIQTGQISNWKVVSNCDVADYTETGCFLVTVADIERYASEELSGAFFDLTIATWRWVSVATSFDFSSAGQQRFADASQDLLEAGWDFTVDIAINGIYRKLPFLQKLVETIGYGVCVAQNELRGFWNSLATKVCLVFDPLDYKTCRNSLGYNGIPYTSCTRDAEDPILESESHVSAVFEELTGSGIPAGVALLATGFPDPETLAWDGNSHCDALMHNISANNETWWQTFATDEKVLSFQCQGWREWVYELWQWDERLKPTPTSMGIPKDTFTDLENVLPVIVKGLEKDLLAIAAISTHIGDRIWNNETDVRELIPYSTNPALTEVVVTRAGEFISEFIFGTFNVTVEDVVDEVTRSVGGGIPRAQPERLRGKTYQPSGLRRSLVKNRKHSPGSRLAGVVLEIGGQWRKQNAGLKLQAMKPPRPYTPLRRSDGGETTFTVARRNMRHLIRTAVSEYGRFPAPSGGGGMRTVVMPSSKVGRAIVTQLQRQRASRDLAEETNTTGICPEQSQWSWFPCAFFDRVICSWIDVTRNTAMYARTDLARGIRSSTVWLYPEAAALWPEPPRGTYIDPSNPVDWAVLLPDLPEIPDEIRVPDVGAVNLDSVPGQALKWVMEKFFRSENAGDTFDGVIGWLRNTKTGEDSFWDEGALGLVRRLTVCDYKAVYGGSRATELSWAFAAIGIAIVLIFVSPIGRSGGVALFIGSGFAVMTILFLVFQYSPVCILNGAFPLPVTDIIVDWIADTFTGRFPWAEACYVTSRSPVAPHYATGVLDCRARFPSPIDTLVWSIRWAAPTFGEWWETRAFGLPFSIVTPINFGRYPPGERLCGDLTCTWTTLDAFWLILFWLLVIALVYRLLVGAIWIVRVLYKSVTRSFVDLRGLFGAIDAAGVKKGE